MTNASRDQNHIAGKLAVLNTDTVQGQHLVPIAIVAATHAIKINAAATISFTMVPIDPHDENYVDCWLFQGDDGLTYPAVATSVGALLIDSN